MPLGVRRRSQVEGQSWLQGKAGFSSRTDLGSTGALSWNSQRVFELFPFEYCHSRTLAKSSAGGKKRSSYSGSSSSGSSMSSQASSSATSWRLRRSRSSSASSGPAGGYKWPHRGRSLLLQQSSPLFTRCVYSIGVAAMAARHSSSCTRGKTGSSSLVEAVPTLGDSNCCCRRSSMNAGVGELVKLCVGACGDCNGERAPRDVGASRWATSSCDGSFSSGSSANWTLGSRVPGSSLAHTLRAGEVEV
eukprot:g35824.t1